MGVSASSLLDEAKSANIRGQVEADLKEFGPYYRKQFSVARFAQVEDELQQNKQKNAQLLKQKEAPEDAIVLYEDGLWYFDETRKWRERYVVVRANYCLECHESLQTYVKGAAALHKLLPTGGVVLTTEERYMEMVDKCYPDDSNIKEEFAPPLTGMPGQFPVYLRLPYRRDSYFCFRQEAKQAAFLSILSDCIKHQNQDFLKKKTCEVQALLKAVQLYRQDRGQYEAWDMLIGSDVRVMANLSMEKLLPSLGKDLVPLLKARKSDRKKVWFTTLEAAYILVQEYLLDRLSVLKEECRASVQQQEVLMHSDMDQILNTRRHLEEKIRAKVSEPAERLCSESVQPYLGSVLDELMEPISSGFLDGRQLMETKMDEVCQEVQKGADNETLKKAFGEMARLNLQSCYEKISSLQDRLKHLQERFGFCTLTAVSHGAQIDLQQLIENAAYTFELLLKKAMEDNPETAGAAVEKAKHRVLKQYDYDSSTVRKRIFQDALVSITLPFIKKNLADSCKTELQRLEQTVYSDYSGFIHTENVYENILLQILDEEVSKVVKEAASLKRHNLFTESSRSSLSSTSTPSSPASVPASSVRSPTQTPPSPLAVNGLPLGAGKEAEKDVVDGEPKEDPSAAEERLEAELPASEARLEAELPAAKEPLKAELPATEAPLEVEPPATEACVEAELPAAESVLQPLLKVEDSGTEDLNAPPSAETPVQSEPGNTAEKLSVQSAEPEAAAEPETQSPEPEAEVELTEPEPPSEAAEAPGAASVPAEEPGSQPAAPAEETLQSPADETEAPSGGGEADNASLKLKLKVEEAEGLSASDPNSLDVSVGSESPRSDLESTAGFSETSDLPEVAEETPAEAQPDADGPGVQPPDCVDEIRNLVVEVIEVEEPVQRYPKAE